ncbi:hypothetical protein P5808_05335 [Bacillus cereus]|uniref:hypothetical protein n=1 Tax=Bacillus cereus TaxID=1396 RepID=UPI002405FA74|nr:hypothetical protein [Bacillus cereus]MDF9507710.1 hypothetical protein [Bacillus cereus]MDF9593465.1 hypothetical protein [Bacillus cereus]MDF9605431.1 hypothetical protein [Bacillus cereus]MDF9656583.1 hypothetical protein [Bacillus cereus]
MDSKIENNKDKIYHYMQEGQLELWVGDKERSKEAFKKSSELISRVQETPFLKEIKDNIDYYLQELDKQFNSQYATKNNVFQNELGELSFKEEPEETITFILLPLGLQLFEIRGRLHGFKQSLEEVSLKRRGKQGEDLNNRASISNPKGILSANFFKWMASFEGFSVSACINLKDSTLYGRLTTNYFFEGTLEDWNKLNKEFEEKFIKTVPKVIKDLNQI